MQPVPLDDAYREDPSPTAELFPLWPRTREDAPETAPQQASSDVSEARTDPGLEPVTAPEPMATPITAGEPKQTRTGSLILRPRTPFWVLIWRTLKKAWGDRILGLSAEAGFWQLLSLPPLLLAVFGTIGYIGAAISPDLGKTIENSLVHASSRILTASTITNSVQPTIEEVLRNGRPDVISLGFLLSLWSGSTAMATYVNTITIAYGERDARNAIRSRLLALRLYFAQVLTGVLLLPALVLGPTLIDRLLQNRAERWVRHLVTYTYWPLVAALSLSILTSLYHLSVPHRRPWRRAVPGALLAMVIWMVGCSGLRYYVAAVFDKAIVYGTLAAPVAVLLFFYITAFAVLLGAEFYATLDQARRDRRTPPRAR
ncbi:MAG: rane protein [Frankiaceae bacterium]|nr:rane protein [Frankiaceae bacterium]